MSIYTTLDERSEQACELCFSTEALQYKLVAPKSNEVSENMLVICEKCSEEQLKTELNEQYWRKLNDSLWTQIPAVQVSIYRLLNRLKSDWAKDLQSQMYLEPHTQEWADQSAGAAIIHKDSNGNILSSGDHVSLIQDLHVKGANFTAKRGTSVRRIRLVPDNENHIEGKIDGQQIVILTKYVKKQS